ncbi:MAG TPA: hypothetical protein VHO84_07685 [Syntrophorhabdaceae bacterium]|nr:hypothetical protein [Syntrophorhabdaceae bacterium]
MNTMKAGIIDAKSGDLEFSGGDTVSRRYCFKDDFIGFDGHFPGYPVLPAFVQVLLAISVMEEWSGSIHKLLSMPKAKFHKELKPHQEISVVCRKLPGEKEIPVDVKLTTAEGLAADFRIILKAIEVLT